MTAATLLTFCAASLVLALTPGPAVLYIVTRTVSQGRTAGLASVGGVAFGNLGNAIGASFGLAALLAVSAAAFTVLKFAGAAYLVWLGVQALQAPAAAAPGDVPRDTPRRVFRDGFLVALLNPKTAIFFAAFLPQFIDPAHSALVQSVGFGALFVAVASITDSLWVMGAAAAAPWLSRRGAGARRAGRYATAGVYFGLGLFTALGGPRKSA